GLDGPLCLETDRGIRKVNNVPGFATPGCGAVAGEVVGVNGDDVCPEPRPCPIGQRDSGGSLVGADLHDCLRDGDACRYLAQGGVVSRLGESARHLIPFKVLWCPNRCTAIAPGHGLLASSGAHHGAGWNKPWFKTFTPACSRTIRV